MNASSQNPPGALPPELSPVQPPVPEDLRAAYAAYGVAIPAPAGPAEQAPASVLASAGVPTHLVVQRPEPLMPQCFVCGIRKVPLAPCPQGRRYPTGTQVLCCPAHLHTSPVQAATGIMRAAMKKGHESPQELAQAEEDAGILFDPKRAQAIWDAAYAQAKAEDHAEQQERGEQLAVMTDRARRLETELTEQRRALAAVLRLCEGRPSTYHLSVGEIFTAASDGSTVLDNIPTTMVWVRDRGVEFPDGAAPRTRAVVPCTTAYGTRADLVLNGGERQHLASLLGQEVRDPHAKCATDGCGTVDDYDDVQEHADPWPPNGGHDPLCAYTSGISRTCTCTEASPAGGAR